MRKVIVIATVLVVGLLGAAGGSALDDPGGEAACRRAAAAAAEVVEVYGYEHQQLARAVSAGATAPQLVDQDGKLSAALEAYHAAAADCPTESA